MAGVFAGGIHAVVAGHAGLSGNVTVVKGADLPVIDVVAGIAIQDRRYVRRRFAGGGDAIVTAQARLAGQHAVVHDRGHGRGFEALGGVAGVTGFNDRNVAGAGAHGEDIVVAQGALPGQFFEHATDVAVLAI